MDAVHYTPHLAVDKKIPVEVAVEVAPVHILLVVERRCNSVQRMVPSILVVAMDCTLLHIADLRAVRMMYYMVVGDRMDALERDHKVAAVGNVAV